MNYHHAQAVIVKCLLCADPVNWTPFVYCRHRTSVLSWFKWPELIQCDNQNQIFKEKKTASEQTRHSSELQNSDSNQVCKNTGLWKIWPDSHRCVWKLCAGVTCLIVCPHWHSQFAYQSFKRPHRKRQCLTFKCGTSKELQINKLQMSISIYWTFFKSPSKTH